MSGEQLDPGTYWIDAPCPRCGSLEPIPVALSTVLQVPSDDLTTLRVKAKTKAVPHSCGQGTIQALLASEAEA